MEIDQKWFDSFESSYSATESVIKKMKANSDIASYTIQNNVEFLFNQKTKTAVLLKFIIKPTRIQFIRKRNRLYKCEYDVENRITTTSVGRQKILHFLNNEQFREYELVIPVGSYIHEALVYLRKIEGLMEAIYYNPNLSKRAQGTQLNSVANILMKSLGKKLKPPTAFHSKCGNAKGNCSLLCWQHIYTHLIDGNSPFRDQTLQLENYSQFTTTYSYRKYHFEDKQVECTEYSFKNPEIWEQIYKILVDYKADTKDLRKLSQIINAVIFQTYFK